MMKFDSRNENNNEVLMEKTISGDFAMEQLLKQDDEKYKSLPPLRQYYSLDDALDAGKDLPSYAVDLSLLHDLLHGDLKHIKSTPELRKWEHLLKDWDGEESTTF